MARLYADARFRHDPLMQGGGVDDAVAGKVDDPRGYDFPAALVAREYA